MDVTGKVGARPGAGRGRRRSAAVAMTLAVGLVAGGGGVAFAAAAGPSAGAGRGTMLGAGQAGPRSAVPWRRVGPGWVLAEVWHGRYAEAGKPKAAPVSLDLVDPAGGRYQLYRAAATRNPPLLVDWSGDKTRALLQTAAFGGLEEITLASGRVRHLKLAAQASVIGYSRPGGLNLLGWRQTGSRFRLARYSLTGSLAKVLVTGSGASSGVYSDNGTTLAVGAGRGLQLVSNAGGVIRTLPASGTACIPSRWWNSDTILASCAGASARPRLWLVPASGGKSRVLTPQRGSRSPDFGDIGAWRLPSGLYLQAIGPCGTLQIFRQKADGSITLVTIPHTSGNNRLLTAYGSQLLVEAPTECSPTATLLWYNPATRHVRTLFQSGVLGAVPYGRPALVR
jgi:hypothetical protein